jgi:NADH:ubiquinone oxidoreductase subunit F (NADH-binding)/(2Fe-2S) ferredoxin/Pyruvate/2-oxoacid:ferredoxin oxidoreductase delta subunit
MPRFQCPEDVASLRQRLQAQRSKYTSSVTMCAGTACQACGCLPVAKAMEAALAKAGLAGEVRFVTTGCHGFCEQGPLAIIEPGNVFYCHIKDDDVEEIVRRTVQGGEVVERLVYTDPASGMAVEKERDIPFYSAQDRFLLGDNPKLSPKDIEDYVALGGYAALVKALSSMSPGDVLEEVKASGLRGRGGGGYPTGRKWEQCKAAPGDQRYVICNADEGDPGAYMDRSLLEGNPHAVLEGMILGALAIGSGQGFVYVRREYPLAVLHIRRAIEQARELGLLGTKILGSDFSFDVHVVRGGGAFVCGESTALMASLEGRVGEPRAKDVHTVEKGYLDQPTTLNNVETWANVPRIVLDGAAAFAARGTEGSKGTKIFALTGQVKNTGLVEVNMGTTLAHVIFDIGGGPKRGKQIKAVQTGGPSGGCLPVSQFHLPLDFDALAEAGSMMGSGGLVVMDDSACMVDMAKYFLAFLQDESCGKCVPCRIGVGRMLEIVTDICEGRGVPEQIDLLEDLAWTISVGSLCALGKTASNPVLSTLRHFRAEYEAHILRKECPAFVCRGLFRYAIDPASCAQCGLCEEACPAGAIAADDSSGELQINSKTCTRCGLCAETCPSDAIGRVPGINHA